MRLAQAPVLICLLSITLADTARSEYASQAQVFYDQTDGTVIRRMVRIADPEPAMGLGFRWEPAAANHTALDEEGRAQGAGRVVWRLPGLSAHDPRAWHHIYEGELHHGRFHGEGRLRWRDGREVAGSFAHGQLHGKGHIRDAEGNVTEGMFAIGVLQAEGTYRARAGWVWHGPFQDGVMHGDGRMTEAGGRRYPVRMQNGQPASTPPANLSAHPLIAGLRPAQSGPSMADRSEISIYIDQRLAANQWASYFDRVEGDQVVIQPGTDALIDMWNGEPTSMVRMMLGDAMPEDWADTRALTVIALNTPDGERVTLDDLSLQVDVSAPHLRPMLMENDHMGCVPFQPSFNFVNHGWGAVENPRLRVRFAHPADVDYDDPTRTEPSSAWVSLPLSGFDEGGDVNLRDALGALGVLVDQLQSASFECDSVGAFYECARAAVNSGLFGELAPFVSQGYGKLLVTTALAELTYDYTDHFGEVYTDTRHFDVPVSLGFVDVAVSMAECGAGGAWPTEARQFHDITLPTDQSGYAMDLPIRGNRTLASLEYGVKFHAARSSVHVLQAQARFSDGSVRLSPQTYLYFVNPRLPDFTTALVPSTCTLNMDDTGMC